MTMPSSTQLGGRTRIDVRAIERELTNLWKEATPDAPGEVPAVTRVCVLNLVACVDSREAADRATDIIARLTLRHPNRAILVNIAGDASAEPLLDAWVQAHCQLPGPGRPQVCCEQITLEARGAATAYVPGTVLPLLVADVPVVLWWPNGEPFENQLFRRLSGMADRVIVDTAHFRASEAALPRLAALLDQDTTITDLVWVRLTPWREMTAQFFDSPALLPSLDSINRVTVAYETLASGADRTQALLLVAWLASRLGWASVAPLADDDAEFQLRRRDGSVVDVALHAVEPHDDALDRLAALTLEAPGARFQIERGPTADSALTTAEVPGLAPLHRNVLLTQPDEFDLISEELRMYGRNYNFEEALRLAARLVAGP